MNESLKSAYICMDVSMKMKDLYNTNLNMNSEQCFQNHDNLLF